MCKGPVLRGLLAPPSLEVCWHQFRIAASYLRAAWCGRTATRRLDDPAVVETGTRPFEGCLEEQAPSEQGCGRSCPVLLHVLRFPHGSLQGKQEHTW